MARFASLPLIAFGAERFFGKNSGPEIMGVNPAGVGMVEVPPVAVVVVVVVCVLVVNTVVVLVVVV